MCIFSIVIVEEKELDEPNIECPPEIVTLRNGKSEKDENTELPPRTPSTAERRKVIFYINSSKIILIF